MSKTLGDLRDAVIAAMDPEYDLIYVDYRDGLTSEQTDALVRGDWESLWESFEEWESEARWEGAKYHLGELTALVFNEWRNEAETEAEEEWLDGLESDWEHSDEWDEARWALEERDSGEWVRDLVRQTSGVYLRVRIGEDVCLAGEDMDEDVETVVANTDLPDTPEVRETIRRIIPEAFSGPYALTPFLFCSVDVQSIYDLPTGEEAEVTITGGSLLLENVYAGSGWNDDLPEGISITVKRTDLRTDDDQFGYSWDDVCGLVSGAWPATVARVATETKEATA